MQKLYLRILPFFISSFVGILIFVMVDYIADVNWQNLILNIAAGLISVPFIFICYELVREVSEKKIKTKIRNYINFHTEKILFSFLKYIYCWFFPTQKTPILLDENKIQKLYDVSAYDFEKMLTEKTLLGFFIYKNIDDKILGLGSVIKNANLNQYITDDEMIRFMDILRNITLIKKSVLSFLLLGKNKVLRVRADDNPHSSELELFYRNVKVDFGNFDNVDKSKLLEYFKVPTESVELLSHQLYDLISDIKELVKIMEIDFWREEYPYGIKGPNI